jgi:hypothetical protein
LRRLNLKLGTNAYRYNGEPEEKYAQLLLFPTCTLLAGENKRVYCLACERPVNLNPSTHFDRYRYRLHMARVSHQENEASWVKKGGHLKTRNFYNAAGEKGSMSEIFLEMVRRYSTQTHTGC